MALSLQAGSPLPAAEAWPRAVAWKINSEIVLLLGWARAILLQFAHPLVAAGVAEHSQFITQPHGRVKRLRQTLRAMLKLTFGTMEEVEAAARGINEIHDYVQGELREPVGPFPAGTRYSAHDPELLRWVHATLLDTFPLTYERFIGALTPEEKDQYCYEASGMAPLLGAPAGYFPASMAELRAYMDRMYAGGHIVVTETARRLSRELISPPLPGGLLLPLGLALRPLLWLAQLPAIGLLPPAIREAYGFSWGPRHQAALEVLSRVIRILVRLLPPQVRYWPAARAARLRAATAAPRSAPPAAWPPAAC